MVRDSKTSQALKLAYRKGYRIQKDGTLVNAADRKLQGSVKDSKGTRYRHFHVKFEGVSFPIAFHKLQAYQSFGDSIFDEKVHIRHLDGNSLNNARANISLGSKSENEQDKDPVIRSQVARNAGLTNRDYTRKAKADGLRNLGYSYAAISRELGINKSTLSYWYSKTAKKRESK